MAAPTIEELLANPGGFGPAPSVAPPAVAVPAPRPTVNDLWKSVLARQQPAPAPPPMPPTMPAPPPAPPVVITPAQMDAARIAQHDATVTSAPTPAQPAGPAPAAKPSMRDEIRATLADPQAHRLLGAGYGKVGGPGAAALSQPPPAQEAPVAAGPPAPVDPSTLKFTTPSAGGGPGGASVEAPPVVTWGGGGGGAQTIAAHEVPVVAPGRQAELLGAIDAEGKAIGGQQAAATGTANAYGEVEHQKAVGEREIAKSMENAGVDMRLRAQAQEDESKAYRKHIDDFGAKLAKEEIDPRRLMHNAGVAGTITWTIASMLGAVAQGLLHQSSNQVVDHIESLVSQDVAAQRANHEIGREHLADMRTAYAEALRVTGDKEQAERVATGYALEAAKQDAQALTSEASSAVQKAKGAELSAALDERIALVGEKRAETGIKLNPYQQARTVGGSAAPTMKEIGTLADKYIEKQAEQGNRVTPDEGLRYAIKILTTRDPLGPQGQVVPYGGGAKAGEVGGMTKEQRGKIAQERFETQTASDEFNRQIEALKVHPVITGTGLSDAALSHLPQRVAPKSTGAKQQLEGISVQMLQSIGKVAKDADGKPNKEMIKELKETFGPHLGDSPEIKQEKLKGLQSAVNALARQQGATAPEPNAPAAPVPSSFQK